MPGQGICRAQSLPVMTLQRQQVEAAGVMLWRLPAHAAIEEGLRLDC